MTNRVGISISFQHKGLINVYAAQIPVYKKKIDPSIKIKYCFGR